MEQRMLMTPTPPFLCFYLCLITFWFIFLKPDDDAVAIMFTTRFLVQIIPFIMLMLAFLFLGLGFFYMHCVRMLLNTFKSHLFLCVNVVSLCGLYLLMARDLQLGSFCYCALTLIPLLPLV